MEPHRNASDDLLQATLTLFPRHFCPDGELIWVADSMGLSWKNERRRDLEILSMRDVPTVGIMDMGSQCLFLIDVLTIRGPMTSERAAQLNELFSRNFSELSTKGNVFLELENQKEFVLNLLKMIFHLIVNYTVVYLNNHLADSRQRKLALLRRATALVNKG